METFFSVVLEEPVLFELEAPPHAANIKDSVTKSNEMDSKKNGR